YAQFWEALRAGQPQCGEFARRAKTGETFWLKACYMPQMDEQGRLAQVLLFASDATKERQRQSQAESRLKAVDDAVVLAEFHLDAGLVHANENFLRVFGFARPQLAGLTHRALCDPAHAETQEYDAFWEQLAEGTPRKGEFRRRTR